jgi:hypothetical protein
VEKLQEVLAAERDTELTIDTGIEANWVDAQVRTYVNQRRLREGMFEGVVRINFQISKAGA